MNAPSCWSRPRFNRRTLFVVAALGATPLAWFAYREHSRRQTEIFDPQLWRDETTQGEARRLAMADGLVARGDLRGKSRSDVVEILGEPPLTEYFRNWDMVYRLGIERGFISIDSEWLVLRFGVDGRVADCRVVRD